MVKLGYFLSSEEHRPDQLIRHAQLAEQAGFEFAVISDHFHPWVSEQGQSAFVWSVLGGIAQATEQIRIGTAVTCPIMRIHPVLVAQAAATIADMMPNRFFLGLGTGEYLNEHILGDVWPRYDTRKEMLVEAIHIMRELWKGEDYSYDGAHFTVREARIYTLPDELPPIYVAASGDESAEMAGELADGLISTSSGNEIVKAFKKNGGSNKPCYGSVKVCWAKTQAEARKTLEKEWPVSALSGRLHVDLATPKHFEDTVEAMGKVEIPEDSVFGPKPEPYIKAIQSLQENGFDHIYIHQVGPDQEGFLDFFQSTLLPQLEEENLVKE